MPYRPEHKVKTRAKIVSCARMLFNRRGFEQVTIDEIMSAAGLTRGGFYNHFANKEELYSEAVASISECSPFSRALARRPVPDPDERARLLVDMYLADSMLTNTDDQCPLYALPSDVARSNRAVRVEYTRIMARMGAVFDGAKSGEPAGEASPRALAMLALCVGAMVLARTTEDASLARSVRRAARGVAHELLGDHGGGIPADVRASREREPPARCRPKSRPRTKKKSLARAVGPELHRSQITGAKGDVVGDGRRPKIRK